MFQEAGRCHQLRHSDGPERAPLPRIPPADVLRRASLSVYKGKALADTSQYICKVIAFWNLNYPRLQNETVRHYKGDLVLHMYTPVNPRGGFRTVNNSNKNAFSAGIEWCLWAIYDEMPLIWELFSIFPTKSGNMLQTKRKNRWFLWVLRCKDAWYKYSFGKQYYICCV